MNKISFKQCYTQNKIIGIDDIEKQIKENLDKDKDYFVLEHKYQGVYVGKYKNGSFDYYDGSGLDIEDMIELRIFNYDMELHIVNLGENECHIRCLANPVDKADEEDGVYCEEDYLLFGTRAEVKDGWLILKDGRGIKIHLPYEGNLKNVNINNPKVFLKVRNYAEFDENGLITFRDSRLLDFIVSKEGNNCG